MKLSYQWLKQLLPGLKQSPQQLGETLSMQIAEVEEIFKLSQGLEKVIVAEIIKIKSHSHADKLQIVVVNNGKNKQEVVCGAFNIKVGQKVPLALPGANLPNGMKIKPAIIRGIKSNGMLCAEDELGLGSDHKGILILPSNLKTGQALAKALKLDDTILDIENKSLTHRPDLFNHVGFAREIGAVLGIKPKFSDFKLKVNLNKSPIQIKVEDKKLCPRYMAIVMDDIKVAPSPDWFQTRLRNLGIKPINNIVDITNYILTEIGQPLHAFDADKIKENKIIIRRAKAKEKLLALDGQEYKLSNDNLVIADGKKPIALAGIIGGEITAITNSTKKVVIESASFDSVNIRRSAWDLVLRTEAVIRFEKGLPMIFPELGLARAIELIEDLAKGKVVSKIYDIKSTEANNFLKQKKEIVFDPIKARMFIGTDIKDQQMIKILKGLGAQVKTKGKKFSIVLPTHRPDLNIFEDLVEEIVRIYGVEKITPLPILAKLQPVEQTIEYQLNKQLKNLLIGFGFDEVYNYSFADEKAIKYFGQKINYKEVDNPLNEEQKYLRQSLIPGLVKNAIKNSQNFSEFKIFEIGRVFNPEEKTKVAGLIFSKEIKKGISQGDVYAKYCQNKCFMIKSIVEQILQTIMGGQINKIEKQIRENIKYQSKSLNKTIVYFNKKEIGFIGEKDFQTGYFELDLKELSKLVGVKEFSRFSTYPAIKRDLAFLIDKKYDWFEICHQIHQIDVLIIKVEFEDTFENKRFENKYNRAFHITYQSWNRTLKSEEVKEIEKKVIKMMKEKFNALLRDF